MNIKIDNYKKLMIIENNRVELISAPNEEHLWDDNKVVVKTHFTTISAGTEYANVTGDINVEAWHSAEETKLVLPRVIGYASSGVVESVGANVTTVSPGDRVALISCGHRSHHVVNEADVIKIPYEEITLEEAAGMFISTFSLSGARKVRIEAGESVAVMGCGILGLYAVQFCKVMGATPVIAVDPVKEKRELALKLGADFAVDPFKTGFKDKMLEFTEGRGINAAVEVTGKGQGLDMILDCMARHGRISLLGCTRNSDFTIDYYRKVHYPGIELIGAHTNTRPETDSRPGFWCYRDEYMAILRLIHFGKIDFKSMVSEINPIEDAPKIYKRLIDDYANFPIGVLFDWRSI